MLDLDTTRIRRGLARRADSLLAAVRLVEPRKAPASRPVEPVPAPAPGSAAPVEAADPVGAAGPVRARPQGAQQPAPAPVDEAPAEPVADGEGLDPAVVQEIFDEMIRPALQSDGGDITLVKVEGGDVYVQLVGACSSCPSSVLTMKMGIERLLEEELPGFRRLVQIGA